jgi:hypothetical protein
MKSKKLKIKNKISSMKSFTEARDIIKAIEKRNIIDENDVN